MSGSPIIEASGVEDEEEQEPEEQDPYWHLDIEEGALESHYRVVVEDGQFLWRTWSEEGAPLEDTFEDTLGDTVQGAIEVDSIASSVGMDEDSLDGSSVKDLPRSSDDEREDDEGPLEEDGSSTLGDSEGTSEAALQDDSSLQESTLLDYGCSMCEDNPRGCDHCREDAQVPSP